MNRIPLILLFIALHCTTYQTRHTDTAALFIRDKPSQKGASLNLLPRGTPVQVSETEVFETIDKRAGKWLRLKGEPAGYIFDAYLSLQPSKAKGSLIIQLNDTDPLCYGTDFFQSLTSRIELADGKFRDTTKRGRHGGSLNIIYVGSYEARNNGLVLSYSSGQGVETADFSDKSRKVTESSDKKLQLYWHDAARGFLTEDQMKLAARSDMVIDRKTCRLHSTTAWIGDKGCVENLEDYGRVIVSGYYCVP